MSRGKFIASSHSSLNMVENVEFIELVEALSPNYKLPSRFKVRSIIIEEADKLKEHVCNRLYSFSKIFLIF